MAADDKTINQSSFSPRLTPPLRSPARLRLGGLLLLAEEAEEGHPALVIRRERKTGNVFFFLSLKFFDRIDLKKISLQELPGIASNKSIG